MLSNGVDLQRGDGMGGGVGWFVGASDGVVECGCGGFREEGVRYRGGIEDKHCGG